MDTIEPKKRTRVRAYPPEFKARLVAESEQPGASVAKVALAHGLNANMLHTWRREARGSGGSPDRKPEFVPLALPAAAPPSGGVIRIGTPRSCGNSRRACSGRSSTRTR